MYVYHSWRTLTHTVQCTCIYIAFCSNLCAAARLCVTPGPVHARASVTSCVRSMSMHVVPMLASTAWHNQPHVWYALQICRARLYPLSCWSIRVVTVWPACAAQWLEQASTRRAVALTSLTAAAARTHTWTKRAYASSKSMAVVLAKLSKPPRRSVAPLDRHKNSNWQRVSRPAIC